MKWVFLYNLWNASGFGRYFRSYASRSHHLFITLVGHIICSYTELRIFISFGHHWVSTFLPFKPWTVQDQVFAYQTLGKVQDPSSLKCNIACYSQNPLEAISQKCPLVLSNFWTKTSLHEHVLRVCLALNKTDRHGEANR